MARQTITVLDFGGLYKGLIASCVRNDGVYAEVLPYNTPIEKIKERAPIGIILSGGPHSVYEPNSPKVDEQLFSLGIPVLGICYGMQLIAHMLGGKVEPCVVKECGSVDVHVKDGKRALFEGFADVEKLLMSHSDMVSKLPDGFRIDASTKDCEIAAMSNGDRRLYGVQFHPEVDRSKKGKLLLHNFVYGVCNAQGDYDVEDFLQGETEHIKNTVGDGHVILGLSGGLDSCVCAKILQKAVPDKYTCVFVDNGLLRDGESEQIQSILHNNGIKFVKVDAKQRFLSKLAGITNPEEKRKIVGREFVAIFEEEGKKYEKCFFAQGTVQADVVESGTENCAVIKSHHNVGGLPKKTSFAGIVEPLRQLFKNEVKTLGQRLGLHDDILNRHPFPGPGLAIRIIGDVTEEKLDILRKADKIFCEEMDRSKVVADQYFAVLTDMRTVGVMGDDRAYSRVIALRAVHTADYMTCEYVRVPYQTLDIISARIIGEVQGISRVVLDITGKPPATIEWE